MEEKLGNTPPIKSRLIEYLGNNQIVKKDFCRLAGISYCNVVGKSLGSEFGGEQIAAVLRAAPDLNPDWLILGTGPVHRPPFQGDLTLILDRYAAAQREISTLHTALSQALAELSQTHAALAAFHASQSDPATTPPHCNPTE